MGKNRNWTAIEDVALCQAYLSVSEDPIVGTDQSAEQLWTQIHAAWAALLSNPALADRLPAALTTRMARINRDTSKFIAIYKNVLAQNASGRTPEDLI